MTSGTGSLRLTGWNPHDVCCQTPVHCRSCTRNAHTTTAHPTDNRVRTRHSWSWSCGHSHTTPPRTPTDRQCAGWHRWLTLGHINLMTTTRASSTLPIRVLMTQGSAGSEVAGGSSKRTQLRCAPSTAPHPLSAAAAAAHHHHAPRSLAWRCREWDSQVSLACGSLASGWRTTTTHGRGHGLYCTTHTPSCGHDHTTTIHYCESRAAAHPCRPRPHRALLQLFRPLMFP